VRTPPGYFGTSTVVSVPDGNKFLINPVLA
jgi:hypothetical protein